MQKNTTNSGIMAVTQCHPHNASQPLSTVSLLCLNLRHSVFGYVRLSVCASQVPCEHIFQKTVKGISLQFWSQVYLGSHVYYWLDLGVKRSRSQQAEAWLNMNSVEFHFKLCSRVFLRLCVRVRTGVCWMFMFSYELTSHTTNQIHTGIHLSSFNTTVA